MLSATQIAASILAADFARLGEQVREADQGGAGLIHIDVMDGRFVPNLTMGAVIIEASRRSTKLPLDVHLMIVEPDHLLADFAAAGANRITVHVEACPNLHRTLRNKASGKLRQSSGLATGELLRTVCSGKSGIKRAIPILQHSIPSPFIERVTLPIHLHAESKQVRLSVSTYLEKAEGVFTRLKEPGINVCSMPSSIEIFLLPQ